MRALRNTGIRNVSSIKGKGGKKSTIRICVPCVQAIMQNSNKLNEQQI